MNINTPPTYTNFDSVKRHPFYFGSKEKPLLGWLHTTDSYQHSNTGIIICPPLAVEYMNSYCSLRYVADYFALVGIPALRFDYHGTGDSSGIEEDGNRLDDWLWSIQQAKKQLEKLTSCTKFGLFGFRMGATLAALTSQSSPIDFLILWATLNSGRKYIREIKLLQRTGAVQTHVNGESLLEAGGMGYWAQTVNDISKINLTKITPQAKRILIIPRDEQITDTELLDAWKQSKLNVEQKNHIGSTLMLVDAHQTVVPHQTINNIVQWVQQGLDEENRQSQLQSITHKTAMHAEIKHINGCNNNTKNENSNVRETIFHYGSNNKYFAILSETEKSKKSSLPTIIITNSGANHRVGPSRLYVLFARELSLMGFRCLRIDVPGIGDSILSNQEFENIEYITSSSDKILDVIKKLGGDSGNGEFILMGLCSGAYFSFHAALDLAEIKITESVLINPLTFYWQEGMTEDNSPTKDFSVWNWYRKALANPTSWIKLLKGQVDCKNLFQAVKSRARIKFASKLSRITKNPKVTSTNKHQQQLSLDLSKITDNNTHIQFILSRNDPGYDILMTNAGKVMKKAQKDNKINIAFIENADHTFSKYKPRCDVISKLMQLFQNRYK